MADKRLNVFNLGELGVVLTKSPIHVKDGELMSAQNAAVNPEGGIAGIRKRLGMNALTSAPGPGAILAIQNVPLPDPSPGGGGAVTEGANLIVQTGDFELMRTTNLVDWTKVFFLSRNGMSRSEIPSVAASGVVSLVGFNRVGLGVDLAVWKWGLSDAEWTQLVVALNADETISSYGNAYTPVACDWCSVGPDRIFALVQWDAGYPDVPYLYTIVDYHRSTGAHGQVLTHFGEGSDTPNDPMLIFEVRPSIRAVVEFGGQVFFVASGELIDFARVGYVFKEGATEWELDRTFDYLLLGARLEIMGLVASETFLWAGFALSTTEEIVPPESTTRAKVFRRDLAGNWTEKLDLVVTSGTGYYTFCTPLWAKGDRALVALDGNIDTHGTALLQTVNGGDSWDTIWAGDLTNGLSQAAAIEWAKDGCVYLAAYDLLLRVAPDGTVTEIPIMDGEILANPVGLGTAGASIG